MYLEHYGLSEAPFRITPHTDFFFTGANRGATLEALLYAITHDEGIVKISGEVGSGKTMLCRVLMERLPQSVVVVYLANPSLSREDILYALADELGMEVPEQSRSGVVMRCLQEHLVNLYAEGKQVVVLIDEAHAMPLETLEEIRLLSNLESNRHKLLQLVLFGQPELNQTLSRTDMRQLRERITHNFNLEPLVREDIGKYLDFRMRAAGYRGPNVFSPEAVKLIAQASEGLTRRINILADKALLASFAGGTHQVGGKEAKAAIKDSDFSPAPSGGRVRLSPSGPLWAIAGALVALVLMALWQSLSVPPTNPTGTQSAGPAAAGQATVPATSGNPSPIESKPARSMATAKDDASASTTPPGTIDTVQEKAISANAERISPFLKKLLAESRPWLDSVSPNRWFIQLLTTADDRYPEAIDTFIAHASKTGLDMGQVRVYHADSKEINRFGVIFGDYASRNEAVTALNGLPSELKHNRPYIRQAIQLRLDDNKTIGQ
jgi:type II secretory pathway predicted ATPase ExeA/septal ring-binding cell division protein DamX